MAWISIDKTSGTGSTTVVASAPDNYINETTPVAERTGTITVRANGDVVAPTTINVRQLGFTPKPIQPPTKFTVNYTIQDPPADWPGAPGGQVGFSLQNADKVALGPTVFVDWAVLISAIPQEINLFVSDENFNNGTVSSSYPGVGILCNMGNVNMPSGWQWGNNNIVGQEVISMSGETQNINIASQEPSGSILFFLFSDRMLQDAGALINANPRKSNQ